MHAHTFNDIIHSPPTHLYILPSSRLLLSFPSMPPKGSHKVKAHFRRAPVKHAGGAKSNVTVRRTTTTTTMTTSTKSGSQASSSRSSSKKPKQPSPAKLAEAFQPPSQFPPNTGLITAQGLRNLAMVQMGVLPYATPLPTSQPHHRQDTQMPRDKFGRIRY